LLRTCATIDMDTGISLLTGLQTSVSWGKLALPPGFPCFFCVCVSTPPSGHRASDPEDLGEGTLPSTRFPAPWLPFSDHPRPAQATAPARGLMRQPHRDLHRSQSQVRPVAEPLTRTRPRLANAPGRASRGARPRWFRGPHRRRRAWRPSSSAARAMQVAPAATIHLDALGK